MRISVQMLQSLGFRYWGYQRFIHQRRMMWWPGGSLESLLAAFLRKALETVLGAKFFTS